MRALIRRLLQLDAPAAPLPAPSPSPKSRATRAAARIKRQLVLESRVDFLEAEVNKLRGKITGGLAHKPKPQEEPSETLQDGAGPTITRPPMVEAGGDRWMALAAHRRAKPNGVLPR